MSIEETTRVLDKIIKSGGGEAKVKDITHCMKCDAIFFLSEKFKKSFDWSSIYCPECGVTG